MSINRNYLTKSVFKIGLDCPRKLFYHQKPTEYFNRKEVDPFLEALAQGGYQVGALAQLKYPSGTEVKERDHQIASAETAELLKANDAVVFEGAFLADSFYVRSDIAVKAGNKLRIIEVKSKGWEEGDQEAFTSPQKSRPGAPVLYANWISYIYDLAFQVYVARLNYPKLEVSASMMLLDKTAANPMEGLHQFFLVKKNGRSKEVILTKEIPKDFKGHQILTEIDATDLINQVIEGLELSYSNLPGSIAQKAEVLTDVFVKNQRYAIAAAISKDCKSCEFRGKDAKLKSGFDECWMEFANIKSASSKTMSFDLWNTRAGNKFIADKKYLLELLSEDDLGSGKTAPRQLIQIEKHKSGDKNPWFDKEKLKAEINSWKWPLHFIDFETCTPAIPFKKGFPPYAEVAFQFSHHIMEENGKVSHVGQFIDLTPGNFPSFEFVRKLKAELDKDLGTVFRYSSHENSVLNRICALLEISEEEDAKDLITFIKTITRKKGARDRDPDLWKGDRYMVDLLEVVKNCYYSPLMGSSNSLKYVLPAILAESLFLQRKYSKPIYGTTDVPSLNFQNHVWIKAAGADPYAELPPIFAPEELVAIENLVSDEDKIRNGGAAMMAYCRTQFSEMTDLEREGIRKALLKYCELDTLAMVMLVEYWRSVHVE
jgi:hypothetical protein